ncbi:unnamed protein product [Urochloa humidicola]
MENSSCSIYFLAQVLLLILIPLLLLSLKFGEKHKNQSRLPPGPWWLPIIGSLHHLVKSPLIHHTLADLAWRYNAPIMYLRLGELHAVVISSPYAAQEVMKTHDVIFATRPLSATVRAGAMIADGLGIAFSPYGKRWQQLRKFSSVELLSTKRVRSFRPIREDETARLVTEIAACPPGKLVNITERVATLVANSALRAMMGKRFRRRKELLECITQAIKIATGFNIGDLFPSSRLVRAIDGTGRKAQAVQRKLFELVDDAVEQHRERRSEQSATDSEDDEDMLDVFSRIQEEGGLGWSLDVGDIKAIIVDLFVGGSEPTATTIQWAMAELMRNPNVMQRAQTELQCALQDKSRVTEDDLVNLPYLKLIIKETLRLHTPGPLLLPRECQEACEILGFDVLKGTTVLVNAWAICRDPKYWDEPEVFKPERFKESTTDFMGTNFRYTPFGAGRRICPGLAFSLANVELVLATLLFHFDWQLPPGVIPSELDMTEEMGVAIRRKRDLYLKPTLRVPL